MPRFFIRQDISYPFDCFVNIVFVKRAADGKTVESAAGCRHCADRPSAFFSQVFETSTLDYTIESLIAGEFLVLRQTSRRPAMCPFHSFFLVFKWIIGRRTFVKSNNDISAEVMLDLNGFF